MMITADMEHLWHSHHAKIMRYVRRRLNDDVAEDLTQEVYLRAWESMCSGNGYTKHASGWLYRIAHNLVIDTYRARDRTEVLWISPNAVVRPQLALEVTP